MNPKTVKLNVPQHLREFMFGKPHGIAYREVLQNYNIEIIVPSNPKLPVCFKGFYPDIQYGPRKLEKCVEDVRDLEFRVEVIIGKDFARELKSHLKNSLEKIENETDSLISVFESALVIYNLSEENIEAAKIKLKELFKILQEIRRKERKQRKEPISAEHLIAEEVWFAKDMRRPSQNVI